MKQKNMNSPQVPKKHILKVRSCDKNKREKDIKKTKVTRPKMIKGIIKTTFFSFLFYCFFSVKRT